MSSVFDKAQRAIRFLVASTMILDVDEQGFVRNILKDPPVRHVLKLDKDDPGKEIIIFQDPLPEGDFYLLNPYAEGAGIKAPPLQFFYKSLSSSLGVRVGCAISHILDAILTSKEDSKKSKKPILLGNAILRIASAHKVDDAPIVDCVDEKMVAEFETIIAATGDNVIVSAYVPAQLRSRVFAKCLTDPDFEKNLGKGVRKKTFKVFQAILMGLLQIDSPAELSKFDTQYDTSVVAPPKFWTYLNTMLKTYLAFNDALEEVVSEELRIDLSVLMEVIQDIPVVFPVARNSIQPHKKIDKLTNTRATTQSRDNDDRHRPYRPTRDRDDEVDDGDAALNRMLGRSNSRYGRREDRDRYDDRDRDRYRYDDRRDRYDDRPMTSRDLYDDRNTRDDRGRRDDRDDRYSRGNRDRSYDSYRSRTGRR